MADTGFFYDEDLRDQRIAPFPTHVKSLEQSMLDFTCQDFEPTTKEDLTIQNEAKRLVKGGFKEDRWDDFYRDYFLDPLMARASITGKRPRMSVYNSTQELSTYSYSSSQILTMSILL